MGMVPPRQLPPQSISGIIPYGQAPGDDPYIPRDIYYDVDAGTYREVRHTAPPPDAIPFYRVGYADPVSWCDSEGNRYEPPDYDTPLFAPADWRREGNV